MECGLIIKVQHSWILELNVIPKPFMEQDYFWIKSYLTFQHDVTYTEICNINHANLELNTNVEKVPSFVLGDLRIIQGVFTRIPPTHTQTNWASSFWEVVKLPIERRLLTFVPIAAYGCWKSSWQTQLLSILPKYWVILTKADVEALLESNHNHVWWVDVVHRNWFWAQTMMRYAALWRTTTALYYDRFPLTDATEDAAGLHNNMADLVSFPSRINRGEWLFVAW